MKCPQPRARAKCARITSCSALMRFTSSMLVRRHRGTNVLLHRNAPAAAHAALSGSSLQCLSGRHLSTRLHVRPLPTDWVGQMAHPAWPRLVLVWGVESKGLGERHFSVRRSSP